MEGIKSSGLGPFKGRICALVVVGLAMLFGTVVVSAQVVTQNVNVTGTPAPGHDWQLYRQENEVSCRPNPNNELIIICAYNWYGYSDLPNKLGDAWIGMSWTRDAENFTHHPITGTKGNEYLGADFAADPTVLTFPGGAFLTNIIGDRDGNSKMVVQRLVEMNRETGSPYALEYRQQEISSIQGVNFIDKPDAKIIIQPGGGFREVTITTNEIDDDPDSDSFGQFRQEIRRWPEFTVCVAYAVFGGSNQNIRTYATCSDDFGAEGTWSNPRQISQSVSGGLDQGLTIAALGDTVLYVARRFDSGDGDALIGSIAKNRGYRPGKVFEITDICPFDQQTAPSLENPDRASVRSLGFPWVSATDKYLVLAYIDRLRDAQGNCLPSYEGIAGVGGTRVMIRTSTDGRKWSDPVPVLPFENQPIHFEFQPNIACVRGACNVVYYSTLTESLAFQELLGDSASEKYWETNEFIEDFDVFDVDLNQILRFRRSVDVYSTKINILSSGQTGTPQPLLPVRVSQYQLDYDEDGNAFEIDWSALGLLLYGGMTQPFHGDYLANAVSDWRKNPITGVYESNAGPIGDIADPINRAPYFAAWTDNRRVRGFIYDDSNYEEDGNLPTALPYEVAAETILASTENVDETDENENPVETADTAESKSMLELLRDATPGGPMQQARAAIIEKRPDRFASAYAFSAEGVEDPNPNAPVCSPGTTNFPYPGTQTNIKNSEIYGAIIEDEVRLVSPNVGKPFNKTTTFGTPLQRGFVIGVDNTSPDQVRMLRLVIANQPGETPVQPGVDPEATIFQSARASWRQLPYRPTFTVEPTVFETVEVEPLSLGFVTLFVVATVNDSPITVYAYDENDKLVSQITVNGQTEAGELIDPGTTTESVNLFEIHDPNLIPPDWAELEILPLAESYDNPNFRSPNFRSPNFRSTDYMDPNLRSPNFRSPNYRSDTIESTNLQNPNLRSPNLRSDSFVDVTYTLESENNTTTAYNVDFAYGGDELDGNNVQVIAWQEDQLATAQGCKDGFITESKVISAKANPNFRSLALADIGEPFKNEVSFPLTPKGLGSRVNVTVRILCNEASGECSDLVDMDQENPEDPAGDPTSKLQNLLGYNFSAQKAKTGENEITDNEKFVKDVIPPEFVPELVDGVTFVSQATSGDPDAAAEIDLVVSEGITANDDGMTVGVTCYLYLPTDDGSGGITIVQAPMPAFAPLGDTGAQCDTDEDAQGNAGTWTGFVRVEDNIAPTILVPGGDDAELIVPPDDVNGASVTYIGEGNFNGGTITVSDNIIDAEDLTFSCAPASGSVFGFGPTTVNCTAFDSGPCDPATNNACQVDVDGQSYPDGVNVAMASFAVIVVDSDAPTFDDVDENGFLPDVTEEATAEFTPITLTANVSDDIDDGPIASYLPAITEFPLGTTTVAWTAKDFSLNEATAQQNVIVQDTTAPTITVPGDISRVTNSLSGLNVSFSVSAEDIFATTIECVETGTSTTIDPSGHSYPVGTTSVTCTATDTSGNPLTAAGSSATGTFDVTVVFEYLSSGISGKASGKTGSSFPLEWAWTDAAGMPVSVGSQSLSIEPGTCPGSGNDAQDPGSSGIREQDDGSYQYNLQAVDPSGQNLPAEKKGSPYCFTVSLPTGEFQDLTITLR